MTAPEPIQLSFHGADRTVTGSCHHVQIGKRQILVDCGLYQGSRALREESGAPFGFRPSEVDTVLLTHAHLDHCGRLPLLVRRGFRGQVITTAPTRDLARLVLLDAADLQEEEAERARRKGDRGADPLYTALDAIDAMDTFRATARFGEAMDLGDGIRATFLDAGHILGSACVLLEHGGRRVLFSGDLGNRDRPVLPPPTDPPAAHVVLMETTYGDRCHRPFTDSVEELYDVIRRTTARGGKVLIPSFALERAQEILYFLREGYRTGTLHPKVPVVLDSPMAISATEIYRRHPSYFAPRVREVFEAGEDPFDFPELSFSHSANTSMLADMREHAAILIAGSGMCTGGRIVHHLRRHLDDPRHAVVFVGFAAEGTLARDIIDGATTVKIYGDVVPVRASVHTIGGFSAHADRRELERWLSHAGEPERVVLVHGEPDRGMNAMAERLRGRGYVVDCPELGDAITV